MFGAIILLLAAVFLLAAISKIRDREAFSMVVGKLLPDWLVEPASVATPAAEILLAAWLLSGIAPKHALATAVVLLLSFSLVLAQMWRRGFKGCGCFGETEDLATPGSGIVRNLLLVAVAGLALAKTELQASVWGPDVSSIVGRITIVAGVFCGWPCLVALIHQRKVLIQ